MVSKGESASTTGQPFWYLRRSAALLAELILKTAFEDVQSGPVAKFEISLRLYPSGNYSNSEATIMDFKGSQLERDIILWGVRWYERIPRSYR